MLGALLLIYIIGREAPEPRLPPPPPLPVLVTPAVASDTKTGLGGFFTWYAARWPFGAGILFTGGRLPGETRREPEVPDSDIVRELTDWSARTKRSNRLRFRFTRMVYDDVLAVERRAKGTAKIEGRRVTVETTPANVERGAVNADRMTSRGVHFRIEPDVPLQMAFDGETAMFQEGQKLWESVALPPAWRVDSPFTFAPIPFLRLLEPFQEFDGTERLQNFDITFGDKNKPGEQVHLVLRGRSRTWAREFQCVEILLRAGTYEPIAVRWFDPAGTKETVYVFSDVRRE